MKRGRKLLLTVLFALLLTFTAAAAGSAEDKAHFYNSTKGTFYLEPNGKGGWVFAVGFRFFEDRPYYFHRETTDKWTRGQMGCGLQKIDGHYYYFYTRTASNKAYIRGQMATGFAQVPSSKGSVTMYFFPRGTKLFGQAATGWQTINGKRYYFSSSGILQTGIRVIDKKGYYFAPNGSARGQMQTGFQTVNGNTYYFGSDGASVRGWQTISGARYYFLSSGVMVTGLRAVGGSLYCFSENGNTKGQMQTGFQTVNGKTYYFGSDGAALRGWQTIGGTTYYFGNDYVLTNKQVNNVVASDACGTMKEKTLWRAEILVSKLTTPGMSKEEKLRACFMNLATPGNYGGGNPRIPHYTGMDWVEIYANDIFIGGSGNCLSMAAAFAYMAKACGYTEVYGCNSTGHGWTEINGLIYDPEQYRDTANNKLYAVPYSQADSAYSAIFGWGLPFTRIKI